MTVNALQYGSALEMLSLAFSLADRFTVTGDDGVRGKNSDHDGERRQPGPEHGQLVVGPVPNGKWQLRVTPWPRGLDRIGTGGGAGLEGAGPVQKRHDSSV